MPLITGEQYTESTRALNLPVYIFGKKVENPVDDPILRPALSSVRIENLCFGTVAVGYRTESMHGAGSPQAQRIRAIWITRKSCQGHRAYSGIAVCSINKSRNQYSLLQAADTVIPFQLAVK